MEEKIYLGELFTNDEEFLKELNKVEKLISKYKKYEGHLYDSAEKLYEFLEFDSNISQRIERLYLYAHINNDLDLKNQKYQEYVGKVLNLFNNISLISSFVLPELLVKDSKNFNQMFKEYPSLKEYKNSISKIFRLKPLILSKNQETTISLLTSNFDKTESTSELLINTDLDYGFIKNEKGENVKLTNSNYSTFLENKDRSIRENAFKSFYKEIASHENTFASLIAWQFSNANKVAKLRGFKDARDLSLYKNNIDTKIYDSLIKGVNDNLKRFYSYYELKKKILSVDSLHIYDTYANITKSYDKNYSFKDGKKLILDALRPLGDKYQIDLKNAFENNWIDARLIEGKRDGGYCTCAYLAHPYIVINYEKKLNDVSTLAHELGHAMHYLYAKESNTYQDYEYSIFVAEVASQVNEILLTNYVYDNSTDIEEKKYLLDLMLNRFKSTIIRQTMFAEFEDEMHKIEMNGDILTKDKLINNYYELNKKYFGPAVLVDDEIKYECFRIPHFYYDFYVYQYATGYAAALKIADGILSGDEEKLKNYLQFLSLGSTKSPVESLKIAGIDINDNKIYDDVFTIFENRLNELRSLYE